MTNQAMANSCIEASELAEQLYRGPDSNGSPNVETTWIAFATVLIEAYGIEMFDRGRTRGHHDQDWDKVEANL